MGIKKWNKAYMSQYEHFKSLSGLLQRYALCTYKRAVILRSLQGGERGKYGGSKAQKGTTE